MRLACFLGLDALLAAEATSLDARLELLRPLLGKTRRDEFKDSTPDKPVIDGAR